MIKSWTQLEGSTVAGVYTLQQWLSGDEAGAFFLTSREGNPALVKLVAETRGSAQLGDWKTVERLAHPNLLPILDCGQADSFIYAVFEYPDDNLAAALAHGGLTEGEKREVLDAGLGALRYIHSRGMVHGAVTPEHVVAVGDHIKLTSDTIVPATASDAAPEEDIRALHAMLDLPYTPPAPPPVREPAPPHAAREPLPPARPARQPEPETAERAAPGRRGFPLWVYPAAAAVAIGGVLAIPRRTPPPQTPPARTASTGTPPGTVEPKPSPYLPVSPETAPPTKSHAARPPASTRPAETAPAESTASRSEGTLAARPVWRVVAYTYSRYRDAQVKAERINDKMPGLHANVFTPKGKDHPPYFVALGGKMTRAEAVNVQRVAMAKGLPRDTFVRNYPE